MTFFGFSVLIALNAIHFFHLDIIENIQVLLYHFLKTVSRKDFGNVC